MLPRPDQATDKQLRGFSFILPFALAFVAWMVWRHAELGPSEWPLPVQVIAVVSLLWALLGAFVPRSIRPLYLLLGWAAYPIGLVLSTLIVGFVFFVIVTPIGLWLRLRGRDELRLKKDPGRKSMWIDRDPQQGGKYSRMF